MGKNYLIAKGPKGLTDLELQTVFGFLLLDSKLSEGFLKAPRGNQKAVDEALLERRFKKFLATAVEGDGLVDTAKGVFGVLADRNNEHSGLKDVLEWAVQNREKLLELRGTWTAFQNGKYGNAYGQCDTDEVEFVDLLEAARIIRWRAK